MKLNYLRFSLFIIGAISVFVVSVSSAAVGTAVASGNWNSSSTWLINGVNRLPNNGDTITIPSGYTVSVNSQNDYSSGSQLLYITVGGILQFTNGNKLQLPCNSTVDILLGGTVKKATAGGGNSTFIEICGTVEWKAGDGQLDGPVKLGGNTLPISLLFFGAVVNDNSVDLTWATSSEINNDFFTVERSYDGEKFSKIAIEKGAGNSTVNLDYAYRDENPLHGVSYYRLMQSDFDGRYSYSSVVAIQYLDKNSFEVIAVNSESSFMKVILKDPDGGRRLVTVSQLDGSVVEQMYLQTKKGTEQYEILNSKLNSGLYSFIIQDEYGYSSKKFFCD